MGSTIARHRRGLKSRGTLLAFGGARLALDLVQDLGVVFRPHLLARSRWSLVLYRQGQDVRADTSE